MTSPLQRIELWLAIILYVIETLAVEAWNAAWSAIEDLEDPRP